VKAHPLRALIATLVVVYGLVFAAAITGNTPKLGLDLQGGVSVNLQPVKDGEVTDDVTEEQLDQAIEIIRNRVDAVGVAEPEVTRQGNTITVQLPGATDQQEVLDLVGKTAQLEFRPVLSTAGAQLTGDDRVEAESTVEELRTELGLPEGVTAQQVAEQEQSLQAAAAPTTTVPADPGATTETTAPTETPVSGGAGDEQGMADPSNGNGGSRSARAVTQDETTTTAAPDGEATTTTAPPAPLNEWGIDLSDEKFGELYQLESQLAAQLTPEGDRTAEGEVTLSGEDGTIYTMGPVALTGTAVEGATAALQGTDWAVSPTFKSGEDGIDLFNAIASQCYSATPDVCPGLGADEAGNPRGLLGIVLDDEVLSAPSINQATFERDSISITGSFTQEEAESLAVALRYGSLPIELEPQQAEIVSATLGQGALEAGIISGVIGLLLAAIYLVLYYRLLALIAVAGLVVAASALYVIMAFLNATVTLAGVVGIVVSIGVTVDSAVVYYEAMKEQVRSGISVRVAADRAFDSAGSTIVKANIASIIGAAILYWLAVGPVRGFAFYLGAMSVLDLVMLYLFVYPATAILARSRQGEHPRRLGLDGPPTDAAGPVTDQPTPADPTSTGVSS
jgi:preprotein translocase subunit SecD